MVQTLYITCNLKPAKLSRSLQIGQTFLDAYTRTNPKDTVHHLDLYSDQIQRIDADVVSGWSKLRQGVSPFFLTDIEQIKVSRISALADQFISTDKYVFVTPLWNLGFPAEVKMYIDAVCQVGKSFKYTPTGAVGLLEGKKCLHIHSMGGMHHGRPEDHSTPYLKSIMNFMGVKDYTSIVVEGVDAMPEEAENLMAAAKAQAAALASEF